ncbi:Cation/H(+) antiporter 15 [Quillaja saponaria]|uniref:Cation/H(+) antiporter 15 n=1 Tax=Quillaja saponaria TaxID=32244 RepID=A0AAD7PQY4_QUISA|nr:Cation/H(+) antiporter 15 [Quillaja saponaria]
METGEDKLIQETLHAGMGESMDIGDSYVCHVVHQINSRGLWFGDDPLTFSFPLLLLQLFLISISTRSIYIILKPFGQPSIVSQILGGVVLGPSILGRSSAFANKVFPAKGRSVLETFAFFGFMLFIFLIGVKIDPSIILRSGKRALCIGILGFSVPFVLAGTVACILYQFASLDDDVSNILFFVVSLQSITAFPVIACFLTELKILNSEIGRLASASSIVCDVCYWSVMTVSFAAKLASEKSIGASIGSFVSAVLLISFIMFGVRPAALWAIRRTPEGKPVKEIYIFVVFVTLLVCGFMGELIGLSAFIASFLVGLAIPEGPPLGAALVDRLDCFCSVLLMPILFTIGGLKMDVFAIQKLKNVGVIQLIIFVSFFGKIVGTVLPPLFCRMPFRDALSLGLIMNSKGIVELVMLIGLKVRDIMSEECYTIMVISLVIITGVVSPIVKVLYDPSSRFLAYKRRTILHQRDDEELRILACIHRQDNVLAILNLLAASNPNKESPINLVALHLVKLAGRASSLLVAHLPRDKPSQYPTQTEQIFNAFRKFEHHHSGHVILHCYKGISPYATMHNDVCSLALEKRTTFIIIPFHKQWIIGGRVESSYAFRHLNKNVLDKAPCSVGVLIDRGNQSKFWCDLADPAIYQVAVLFFGGADDREALAYARRMMEQHNVLITLLHFSAPAPAEIVGGTARSKMLDTQILSEFRLNAFRNDRVSYRDEQVTDGRCVLTVLESMECTYDLVLVGRRHGESRLMSDLRKWNERGELGVVGEILATTNFKGGTSILVMQQQTRLWGLRDPEESTRLRRVNI